MFKIKQKHQAFSFLNNKCSVYYEEQLGNGDINKPELNLDSNLKSYKPSRPTNVLQITYYNAFSVKIDPAVVFCAELRHS